MQIIKKSSILIIIVVLFTILSVSVCYSQNSSSKAKSILEKTFRKYDALFSDEIKGVNSAIIKMSIKGEGRINPNAKLSPPLLLDTKLDIYAVQSNKMFIDVTGNLGNIQIVLPGKMPIIATAILPATKQFTTIQVPQKVFRGLQPKDRERFWIETNVTYGGLLTIKQKQVHKIIMKPNDPKQKGNTVVYILDRVWDPIKYEINDPVGGNTVVNFDEIRFDVDIPLDKFEPKTSGYTQVTKEQFTGLVMMQMMTSTMQNNQIK
jgi:hypothetical protein